VSKITNFFKKIKIPNGDDITALWVIYIMMPVFAIILIFTPFFAIYMALRLITPSEIIPDSKNDFKNISIIKYKELDKRNKDNRLFRITFKRDVDKSESDSYISELKRFNDNRFEFSDIQKFLFLRDDVNEVNSIETTIHINCDNGIFSIGPRAYKFNGKNTSLRTRLNKYEFEAKKYPEIDNMATKLCAKSKKHSVY